MPASPHPACPHNAIPGYLRNAEGLIPTQHAHFGHNLHTTCRAGIIQPWPSKHLHWKLSQNTTGCQCKMKSPWKTLEVPEAPWNPEKKPHGQLRKEIQPKKVKKKVQRKSWFSLVYKFLFQLNLNYQPRVWLYENYSKPYGFCYTPEPHWSAPNPLLGSVLGPVLQRRQEQGPESSCVYFAIWHQNGSLPQGQRSMDSLKLLKSRT